MILFWNFGGLFKIYFIRYFNVNHLKTFTFQNFLHQKLLPFYVPGFEPSYMYK